MNAIWYYISSNEFGKHKALQMLTPIISKKYIGFNSLWTSWANYSKNNLFCYQILVKNKSHV